MISVLYEPLFTAEYLDGSVRKIGLREMLLQAHNIRDIVANTCTGKVALYRLFIAFVMDAWKMEDTISRGELLEESSFDQKTLDEYISLCESEGANFCLDDEERPFMQSAYNDELDAKAEKPIAALFLAQPSGNNHVHWEHGAVNDFVVGYGEAFEALLETYTFCTSGTAGPSNVNNTPPLFSFIHGENLFQTIVLNSVSECEVGNLPYGRGEVAWRIKDKIEPKKLYAEISLLRGLTWQPRRITLTFEEGGIVRSVYLQAGLNYIGDALWRDPNLPHRQTKEETWATIKPSADRALWREAGTLAGYGKKGRTALTIENIRDVWADVPRILDIELIGIVTNQAAFISWSQERLAMPVILLKNEDIADEFRETLRITEEMYSVLSGVVRRTMSRSGRKIQEYQVAEQAGEIFLQVMRSFIFGEYMLLLEHDTNQRMTTVWDAVMEALIQALRQVVEHSGNDIATLRKQNEISAVVMGSYYKKRKGCLPNE